MSKKVGELNFIIPTWPAPPQIKAYTTLRDSGSSNITIATPQENESDLINLLQLPAPPIWLQQQHGIELIEARALHKNARADASFATHAHQVCVILTADCLPILLCNKTGTIVAALHAGWRGLSKGIIEHTLSCLSEEAKNWLVWLGPAISAKKFIVGEDVYQAFTLPMPITATCFTPVAPKKWLADLYGLAKLKLNAVGVPLQHIYGGEYCTYSQADLFYSYRRDQGHPGRLCSVIWIDNDKS